MNAPDIDDIEWCAVNVLAKRRREPHLEAGVLVACGAVLDLFGWSATVEEGQTTRRPAGVGPDVWARIQLSDSDGRPRRPLITGGSRHALLVQRCSVRKMIPLSNSLSIALSSATSFLVLRT